MPLEREHKFLLEGPPPAAETLRGAFSAHGFDLEASAPRTQLDRYFDTPERDLGRAGVALRTRAFGGQTFATFKAAGRIAGSLHSREELELPFQAPWPAPISARVAELVDPEQLEAQLELRTERTRYLVGREGQRVAELSFDAVRARRPDAPREVSFQELELEALENASEETLARVAEVLETHLLLHPSTQNKLTHALALLEDT